MVTTHQQMPGSNTPDAIQISPLTLHIGAEISGIDLTRPLPEAQLRAVRDAFLKWKVVFFRGQHLDHAQQVAMARQFGEPTIGHAVFGHVEGYPEVYSVAKNRTANENRTAMMVTPWSGWHTDVTAAVNPPCASILRGVTIPPYGGDTFWTNLVAAYNGLSPTLRGFVDGLRGIHKFAPREGAKSESVYNARVKRRVLESEHPLVTVHAETGERAHDSPHFRLLHYYAQAGTTLLDTAFCIRLGYVTRGMTRSVGPASRCRWRGDLASKPTALESQEKK